LIIAVDLSLGQEPELLVAMRRFSSLLPQKPCTLTNTFLAFSHRKFTAALGKETCRRLPM